MARVVSYNVLSSSLCQADYWKGVEDKSFLDAEKRFEKITERLDAEIGKESIICLQELSIKWTARLHTYFHEHGYCFIADNYGSRKTGYMGVGIAFPPVYALKETRIVKMVDTKPGGWKRDEPTWWERYVRARPTDAWDEAQKSFNSMITLRLAFHTDPDLEFCVSTYHMPCRFWDPPVMTIHAVLAARAAVNDDGLPSILAGDFNLKPSSPQYALLTTGLLPDRVDEPSDAETHGKRTWPEHPCFTGDKFSFTAPVLESAYTTHPEFTNRALAGQAEKTFSETLDYLFYTPGTKQYRLSARSTDDLSKRCKAAKRFKSLPSDSEPSDHLMIGAEFAFVGPTR